MSAEKPKEGALAEPQPRPADPKFRWTGMFWQRRLEDGEFLSIHPAGTKKTPRFIVRVGLGEVSMTQMGVEHVDTAAALAHRLAGCVRGHLAAEAGDDIPF